MPEAMMIGRGGAAMKAHVHLASGDAHIGRSIDEVARVAGDEFGLGRMPVVGEEDRRFLVAQDEDEQLAEGAFFFPAKPYPHSFVQPRAQSEAPGERQ